MLPTDRGFWLALVLNIVTLGFYNWYLIYSFASETNTACSDDMRSTKGLFLYIVLSVITFGIYPIFWTYNWIDRCNNYLINNGQTPGLSPTNYLLSVFFGWITLGIWNLVVYCKMLYLQNDVNYVYNHNCGFYNV